VFSSVDRFLGEQFLALRRCGLTLTGCRHIVEVTGLVIPVNSRITAYPEVGKVKPAPTSACRWCRQMQFNLCTVA
jgi:hypothetical protein